jgi:SAM-dependent methyltransferase
VQHLSGSVRDFISAYVKGKTVLDVGCIDHSASHSGEDTWLHKHIVASANSTVGLDVLESDAAKLRDAGYDIVCGDACTASLGRTFDVIVAGEIIEHIDSTSAFLTNMSRHLNEDGRLVLTTPNTFFLLHMLESVFRSPDDCWNPEHVCWYEPFTLRNVLSRNKLGIDAMYYFTRSRKLLRLMRLTGLPSYGPLSSSILVIAKRTQK